MSWPFHSMLNLLFATKDIGSIWRNSFILLIWAIFWSLVRFYSLHFNVILGLKFCRKSQNSESQKSKSVVKGGTILKFWCSLNYGDYIKSCINCLSSFDSLMIDLKRKFVGRNWYTSYLWYLLIKTLCLIGAFSSSSCSTSIELERSSEIDDPSDWLSGFTI